MIKIVALVFTALLLCASNIAQGAESTCDRAAYEAWRQELYTGALVGDPTFWRYQTQRQFRLTNQLALELAVAACSKKFDLLYYYLAGRMGPIDIQHSYKTMCRDECLENDVIHEQAMAVSGCSCLELSTQPHESSYHIEGDFCRHNTARMLCDRVGYCGVWGCRIDDFMCPRYEWNKKMIPFKGIGTCVRGAASPSPNGLSLMNVAVVVTMVVILGANVLL